MYDHGIFSLIPPVLAIVLVIRARQVFVSLLFDIWLGWVIIDDYHLMEQVIINLIRNSLDAIFILLSLTSLSKPRVTMMICHLTGH